MRQVDGKTRKLLNLDANASYGVLPEVYEELTALDSVLLNPSSVHAGGRAARALIDEAREEVRLACGASASDTILFTSGATESNNQIIAGVLHSTPRASAICSAVEHPSVLEPLRVRQRQGANVIMISPDNKGQFSPSSFLSHCREDTRLLSVMLANNETGAVLPVDEIGQLVKAAFPGVLIHTDAVQGLGKMALSFRSMHVDAMTLSGHKVGALPGVGALVIKEGTIVAPLIAGGPQEQKLRAGTENVWGIVSFGIAARVVRTRFEERCSLMARNAAYIRNALAAGISGVHFLCDPGHCIPNTISVRIPGIKTDDLVVALDLEGVLVSSGSACSSGKPEASPVLLAMGLPEGEVREAIRISVKAEYEEGDLELGVDKILGCVRRMRNSNGRGRT